MAQTDSQYRRSGPRRAGDDYQDVVALGYFLDWLEDPDRYVGMTVEDAESGVLDDICKERSDGVVELVQVKLTTTPEEADSAWGWAELLKERKSKRDGSPLPSLLARWCESFHDVCGQGRTVEAFIVSNRRPDADLQAALRGGRLELDAVTDAKIRAEIIQQLGGETRTREFFAATVFQLSQEGLDTLEAFHQRRFFERGGERVGWLNLKDELHKWARHRHQPPPDGIIRLEHIRKASDWRVPRFLPQNFEVPRDFVLPSAQFHKQVLARLKQSDGGCTVVQATPGVGKSTYVSWLCGQLKKDKVPVIRHHYFLSVSDRNSSRVEHQRAADSLLHDLVAEHRAALGDLANRSLQPSDLVRCLEAVGNWYAKEGKRLVLVVDGLDHVWTERQDVEELRQLFDSLLPVPKGITLLVATQPVGDDKLPPKLLTVAPRQEWFELPTFRLGETREWISKHREELPATREPAADDYWMEQIAKTFFDRSGGHPLHLRYSLEALREEGLPVTEQRIRQLPACPDGHIASYYGQLWRSLCPEGRSALLLLGLCHWPWPLDGLVDTLKEAGATLGEAERGRREIRHLLRKTHLGFEPAHASVAAFVVQQEEFRSLGARLRRAALQWLQTSAPKHWRWAYEWLLQADLGNSTALCSGPSRLWAVEALTQFRLPSEIGTILSRASWESALAEDWPRLVALGVWHEYVLRAFDQQPQVMSRLLEVQFLLDEDEYLHSRVHANDGELHDSSLVALAGSAFRAGNLHMVEDVYQKLIDRHNSSLDGLRHDAQHTSQLFRDIAVISPMVGPGAVNGIVNHCLKIMNDSRSSVLGTIAFVSRKIGEWDALKTMLGFAGEGAKFTSEEVEKVAEHAALLALERGLDLKGIHPDKLPMLPLFVAVHSLTHGQEIPPDSRFGAPTHVYSLKDYEVNMRQAEVVSAEHRAFFMMLANHLRGDSDANARWLATVSHAGWQFQLLSRLEEIAKEVAASIARREPFTLGWFYKELGLLVRPTVRWSENRALYEYARAAEVAATNIGLDLLCLLPAIGATTSISAADLQVAEESGYWSPDGWAEALLIRERIWLDKPAIAWLVASVERVLQTSTDDVFETRAEICARIALLAAKHGCKDLAKDWSRRSANFLLAHGYHKDIPLMEALGAVEAALPFCERDAQGNAIELVLLLKQLVPAVTYLDRFTDRDDLHHLPGELANLLGDAAPDLSELLRYHSWCVSKEEYSLAEEAFAALIKHADLAQPVNQALAKTVTDSDARKVLVERAGKGDVSAQAAVASLCSVYGDFGSDEDEDRYRPAHEEARQELPAPPEVGEYSPERFDKFVAVLEKRGFSESSKLIEDWVETWRAKGKKSEVLQALRRAEQSVPLFRSPDVFFDLVFDLEGPAEAYNVLIQRYRRDHSWMNFWTDAKQTRYYWKQSKRFYPDRWRGFIVDTLRFEGPPDIRKMILPLSGWARFVEFFGFMGQREMARRLAAQMVTSASELTSPAKLPVPSWANTTAAHE